MSSREITPGWAFSLKMLDKPRFRGKRKNKRTVTAYHNYGSFMSMPRGMDILPKFSLMDLNSRSPAIENGRQRAMKSLLTQG